jgi:hypothetical protein
MPSAFAALFYIMTTPCVEQRRGFLVWAQRFMLWLDA